MKTYFLMFGCGMIVPLIMIICGFFLWKFPPKTRNSFVGYRTGASMKNAESWDFAQKFCGKLWIWVGSFMLIATAVLFILLPDKSEDGLKNVSLIVTAAQPVLMLLTIIPVEIALKKKFGGKNEKE